MTTTESKPAEQEEIDPGFAERIGADALADSLAASGIEIVFGFPGGGAYIPLASIIKSGIRTLPARTELSAAWMSYGYNRVSRRAASACLFHEVGVLHTSPAIYAAKLDSTPLFIMDVNLASTLDLREALQEGLEIYPSLRPLTKYIRRIVTAHDLPLAVRQSVLAASTGRFGPAVLDLYAQVMGQTVVCPTEPLTLPDPPAASPETVQKAIALIAQAERPVLVAGAGAHLSGAAGVLKQFAELLNIPVVSTSRGGRGIMADDHELYAGPLGSFGWTSANEIAQQADLWIALGTSFSQVSTAAWTLEKPAKVIHIDIDGGEIGKIFQPTLGIAADAKMVLQQLVAAAPPTSTSDGRALVAPLKASWFAEYRARFDGTEVPVNQLHVINVLNEEMPPGTIYVGDSGGHAGMLARGISYDGTQCQASGPRYQSLGASLPIAIGAKLAMPDRTVVSYHGDGGFYYDCMDLSTLSSQNIKVIVIIDNNGYLLANRAGMQMLGFSPEVAAWAELPDTDFVGLARSMGVAGERVEDPADVRGAIQRALASDASYLIDVKTDPETRMKRAIPGLIPILSDRPFLAAARAGERKRIHFDLTLDGAWPIS